MNLTGAWVGSYSYAEQYGESAPLRPTAFRMFLRDTLFGHRVTGTVQDDPTRGVPEEAEIRGSRILRRVNFVKSYPILRMADPESQGTVTLEEFLEREYDEIMPAAVHPRSIFYRGVISQTGEEMEGVWYMKPEMIFLAKLNQWINLPGAHGTWKARQQLQLASPPDVV